MSLPKVRKAVLISSDRRKFIMDFETALRMLPQIAEMLKSSLEGYEHEENKSAVAMMKTVNGDCLELIVEWAEKHKDDPPDFVIRSEVLDYWSDWDRNFVEKNKDILEELEKAAYFFKMIDLCIAIRIVLGKGYYRWLEDLMESHEDADDAQWHPEDSDTEQ